MAQFHGSRIKRAGPEQTIEYFQQSLSELFHNISWLLPRVGAPLEQLVSELSVALSTVESKKCPIHGDFYSKQVLVKEENVSFIDIDDIQLGFAEYDLGLFIAHLERDVIKGKVSRQQSMDYQQALLEGYYQSRDHSLAEVALFCALGLLKLAHHPFRNASPLWPIEIERLVLRAAHWHQVYTKLDSAAAYDGSMPALFTLLDRELLAARLCQQGFNEMTPLRVDLARYKTHKRALLEIHWQGKHSPWIGKVRAKGLDKKTFHLNCQLSENSFYTGLGVVVPTPIVAFKQEHCWFQAKEDGEALFETFVSDKSGTVASKVANAIYQLHHANIELNKTHCIEDELAILARRLQEVISAHSEWSSRLENLLVDCVALSQLLVSEDRALLHRDFYHDQMLWREGEIVLLDLDLACYGDPALDLGNFVAHIEEQCLRYYGNVNQAQESICAFIEMYPSDANQKFVDRIAIYTLLSWARHIWISQKIENRNQHTESIISYCEMLVTTLNAQYADQLSP